MIYSHTKDLSAVRPCRYSCISTKFIPPVEVGVFSTEQVKLFQKVVNVRNTELFTTTHKIAQLKELYIWAFNWMVEQLLEKRARSQEQAQFQTRSQLTLDLVGEGEAWN
ncbi:hypothetical protein ACW5WK_03505 [Aeromonas enteropelogenes]|uniref:hypothetical protein n=1 Tax=Aeromonas enteropelogenes TaxID=29489 RepID=UPI0005A95A79|nr:hypothetical protein [Aeromonas enteropelogenes]UBH57092.1 hypothetical protein LA341_04000 [Aeromonas enteropelogenes]